MWTALALLALLVLLTAWVTKVNERHEQRRASTPRSADERIAVAWDDFGLAEDATQVAADFDRLASEVDLEAVVNKTSLARMAVMAVRAGRYALLSPLAARAEALDGGCGETGALAVLAAAYAGDVARARELFARSQRAISGCASCGAGPDVKILMQEVAIALQALEDGALGEPGSSSRAEGLSVQPVPAASAVAAPAGDDNGLDRT